MKHILAVDSGGTKTEAILVDEDGNVLGWGRYDASLKTSGQQRMGSGRSREAVSVAIMQALGERRPKQLCVKQLFTKLYNKIIDYECQFTMTHIGEYSGAYMLAGETCGIVALSGTGAFVHAETRDGKTLHLDGFGPNLGDYGSGYQIGIQAIKAAARSIFHPRHHTTLVDPVLVTCLGTSKDKSVYDLIQYMLQMRDRSEIAALAKVVNTVAVEGDAVARRILENNAAGLAETLFDVVDRLGIANDDYVLVGSGSVCTKSDIFWAEFCRLAKEIAPNLRPVRPTLPNVVGEALLMLKLVSPEDWPQKKERLLAQVPEIISKGSVPQLMSTAANNSAANQT